MKKYLLILIAAFSLQLMGQTAEKVLKAVDYDELKTIIQKDDGKLYVVNFWATWCKPCIEEVPDLMEVNEIFEDESDYQMILVTLDHKKLLNTKVKKFIEKHNITTDVYLLDDSKRMSEWMSATDISWRGEIPVTVFYKNGKKLLFRKGQLTKYELEDIISMFLEE